MATDTDRSTDKAIAPSGVDPSDSDADFFELYTNVYGEANACEGTKTEILTPALFEVCTELAPFGIILIFSYTFLTCYSPKTFVYDAHINEIG